MIGQAGQYSGCDLAYQIRCGLRQVQSGTCLGATCQGQLPGDDVQRFSELCSDMGAVGAAVDGKVMQNITDRIAGRRGRVLQGLHEHGLKGFQIGAGAGEVYTVELLRPASRFFQRQSECLCKLRQRHVQACDCLFELCSGGVGLGGRAVQFLLSACACAAQYAADDLLQGIDVQ